jgi:hypothetical protein
MNQKISAVCAALVVTLAPFWALGQEMTISGFNQVQDFDCAGAVVLVDGVNHDLAITDLCQSVTVSGAQNKVVFEGAAAVTLVGASNQAAGVVAGNGIGTGPDVTLAGVDNVLTLRFDRPAVVEIAGSGNRLIWSASTTVSQPDIRLSGENNIIEAR